MHADGLRQRAGRRAGRLGIKIGTLPAGANDAITDVAGVRVGQVTHVEGQGKLVPGVGPVRTGLTAIIPRTDIWHKRMYAAAWPLNGNGEMTGTLWINEAGWIETPMTEHFTPLLKMSITARIPMMRWGRPEEIAATALFLASDASAYYTGQWLSPNGGIFTG